MIQRTNYSFHAFYARMHSISVWEWALDQVGFQGKQPLWWYDQQIELVQVQGLLRVDKTFLVLFWMYRMIQVSFSHREKWEVKGDTTCQSLVFQQFGSAHIILCVIYSLRVWEWVESLITIFKGDKFLILKISPLKVRIFNTTWGWKYFFQFSNCF